ncbi:MAG: hypothetical protein K8U03_04245 [Planctomycetia bacterium]|nr:hypothetical protein [Planctomycetia bacterium]
MKFALLTPDADALALTAALLQSGDGELTAFFAADPVMAGKLQALAPDATRIDEWEGVLAGSSQAVVVGCAGPAEPRFEQLRRLVLENVPVVFVHPFGLAPLEYHELDMNRQATKTPIVPYEPTRHHPGVEALSALARSNEIGRIEQVVVERQAKERARSASLSRFVRDIGMVRRIAGECEKVSALGKLGEEPNVGSASPATNDGGHLGVQITTTDGVLIRWSIGPIAEGAGAKTTLIGTSGSAVLAMPDVGPWTLQVRRGDDVEARSFVDADPATNGLAAITQGVSTPSDDPLWREALGDLELVEAVERSLRKGRTVELFHEEASEQGTFHGVMAAGGCLLMMLSIGLAIVATVFGKFRFWLANLWPYALLFVLSMFLLMQLFKFVFPAHKKDV